MGERCVFKAMDNDVWNGFVRGVEGRAVIAKGSDDDEQDDTMQPRLR